MDYAKIVQFLREVRLGSTLRISYGSGRTNGFFEGTVLSKLFVNDGGPEMVEVHFYGGAYMYTAKDHIAHFSSSRSDAALSPSFSGGIVKEIAYF